LPSLNLSTSNQAIFRARLRSVVALGPENGSGVDFKILRLKGQRPRLSSLDPSTSNQAIFRARLRSVLALGPENGSGVDFKILRLKGQRPRLSLLDPSTSKRSLERGLDQSWLWVPKTEAVSISNRRRKTMPSSATTKEMQPIGYSTRHPIGAKIDAARTDNNQTTNTSSAVQTCRADSEVFSLREVVFEESPMSISFFGFVSLDRSLLRRIYLD